MAKSFDEGFMGGRCQFRIRAAIAGNVRKTMQEQRSHHATPGEYVIALYELMTGKR